MIKFWRNRKKVTSEQEERVWDRIDSLYSKLEEGKATEDELKRIDGISKIIMDVTGKSSKGKKETATPEELDELTKRDLDMLARMIGIEGLSGRTGEERKEIAILPWNEVCGSRNCGKRPVGVGNFVLYE